jgi:type III pantothenate kinase
VDIGNTNANFGVFRGNKIIKKFSISTKGLNYSCVERKIKNIQIDNAIISSVVPSANKILEKNLKVLSGKQPYVLGKNLTVPIKNLYRKPRQVGWDRLVNAYAGIKLFGSPLIIVDFGTAVTFDIVSKNKEYLGGLILPGLNISLEALSEKTALLPKVSLKSPKELIGKDTQSSMLSGVVYGFSVLVDGLIKKIKTKINKNPLVIGTGGNIHFIARYCRQFNRIESDLTLKGLNFIYGDTLNISARGRSLPVRQAGATFCGGDFKSGLRTTSRMALFL